MTAVTPVDQLPLVTALPVEHLFDMHVNLLPAQPIPTPVGSRMTFITTGGVVEGPKLRGELLPGGGDWLLVGSDLPESKQSLQEEFERLQRDRQKR